MNPLLYEVWGEIQRVILPLFGVHTCSRGSYRTGHLKACYLQLFSYCKSPKVVLCAGVGTAGVLAAQILVTPELGTLKAISDYC